jgi:hypothetical protein
MRIVPDRDRQPASVGQHVMTGMRRHVVATFGASDPGWHAVLQYRHARHVLAAGISQRDEIALRADLGWSVGLSRMPMARSRRVTTLP